MNPRKLKNKLEYWSIHNVDCGGLLTYSALTIVLRDKCWDDLNTFFAIADTDKIDLAILVTILMGTGRVSRHIDFPSRPGFKDKVFAKYCNERGEEEAQIAIGHL